MVMMFDPLQGPLRGGVHLTSRGRCKSKRGKIGVPVVCMSYCSCFCFSMLRIPGYEVRRCVFDCCIGREDVAHGSVSCLEPQFQTSTTLSRCLQVTRIAATLPHGSKSTREWIAGWYVFGSEGVMVELRNIVHKNYSGRCGSRSVFWHSLAPFFFLWAEQYGSYDRVPVGITRRSTNNGLVREFNWLSSSTPLLQH